MLFPAKNHFKKDHDNYSLIEAATIYDKWDPLLYDLFFCYHRIFCFVRHSREFSRYI